MSLETSSHSASTPASRRIARSLGRLLLTFPYLSSGTGFPDFLVAGAHVLERADAGVITAGFFDRTWGMPTP